MRDDDKKFIIDQLRKDKMIYAIEACAVNLLCILIFYLSGYLENLRDIINIGAVIVAVSYTLYMGIGNAFRLMEIRKLENELKLKISFYLKN